MSAAIEYPDIINQTFRYQAYLSQGPQKATCVYTNSAENHKTYLVKLEDVNCSQKLLLNEAAVLKKIHEGKIYDLPSESEIKKVTYFPKLFA